MQTVLLLDTISAATNRTSGIYDLCDLTRCAVQVTFSGTDLVGTLKLEASLDGTTWVTVAGSTQAVTASTSHIWDVATTGIRYIRAAWTHTSGTGHITVKIYLKAAVAN